MFKSLKAYTVDLEDLPLRNNTVNYCKYTCSFPWQGFKVGKITTRSAAFRKVFLVSVPFKFVFFVSVVALVTWHQCNIIVSVPFIYAGNFPPYVNFILYWQNVQVLATYEQRQTSFSSVSVPVPNADFISTLQFTTKTRITSGLFLIHIYIQLCPNPSLGLDHCCHA